MHWIQIGSLLAIAAFGFLFWTNSKTKRTHAAFDKMNVMAAIENVLSSTDDHDEWDLFLAWPIEDTYLESVRQRCLAISSDYSGTEQGRDISTIGEAKLHLILNELRSRS